MAEVTIEVESRVVGDRGEPGPLGTVQVTVTARRMPVAELIRSAVLEQIEVLLTKRKLEAEEVREVLNRQYLTPAELAAQAERGAVRYPSKRKRAAPAINPEAEVQKALEAFEARRYLIVVDGQQVQGIEEDVVVGPGSKVTFLRLMPLMGG